MDLGSCMSDQDEARLGMTPSDSGLSFLNVSVNTVRYTTAHDLPLIRF